MFSYLGEFLSCATALRAGNYFANVSWLKKRSRQTKIIASPLANDAPEILVRNPPLPRSYSSGEQENAIYVQRGTITNNVLNVRQTEASHVPL